MTTTLQSSDPTLQATFTADQVIFTGGKFGGHSLWLSVSSPERIRAHWEGYCKANGAKALKDPQEVVRVRGLTPAQSGWAHRATNEAGYDTEEDPHDHVTYGTTYVEGPRMYLDQIVISLGQMAYLIETDTAVEYAFQSYEEVPQWMAERLRDQVSKCCEKAAAKIAEALAK